MTFNSALLLNADFRPLSLFPLSTISWKRAIEGVVKDTLTVVSEYDTVVRSPSVTIKLPSVVALRKYIPTPKTVPFTRFNVFLRDDFVCQYCGEKFTPRDLRFDHVHPRAKGGKTTWTNICAACEPCNTRKGDRTVMKPLRQPFQPTIGQMATAQRRYPPSYLHESWTDFLYWSSELEP